VAYTFVINNRGPDTATGVVVSDPLPPGLVFVAVAGISQGTFDPARGTWTVGTLPNGASARLVVFAQMLIAAPVVNTAVVSALEADPNLSNNRATAVVAPLLSPSKRSLLASTASGPSRGRLPVPMAVADLTGDGVADVVFGGRQVSPWVMVFDGATGRPVIAWLPFGAGRRGGVSVAVADATGDGQADIIAAGANGVRLLDGSALDDPLTLPLFSAVRL
jgi:hypothetical protein